MWCHCCKGAKGCRGCSGLCRGWNDCRRLHTPSLQVLQAAVLQAQGGLHHLLQGLQLQGHMQRLQWIQWMHWLQGLQGLQGGTSCRGCKGWPTHCRCNCCMHAVPLQTALCKTCSCTPQALSLQGIGVVLQSCSPTVPCNPSFSKGCSFNASCKGLQSCKGCMGSKGW